MRKKLGVYKYQDLLKEIKPEDRITCKNCAVEEDVAIIHNGVHYLLMESIRQIYPNNYELNNG